MGDAAGEDAPGPKVEAALAPMGGRLCCSWLSEPPLCRVPPTEEQEDGERWGTPEGRGGTELQRGKEPTSLTRLSSLDLGKAAGEGKRLQGQVARPTLPTQTCRGWIISSSFWQQRLRSADLESRSRLPTQVFISSNRKPSGS